MIGQELLAAGYHASSLAVFESALKLSLCDWSGVTGCWVSCIVVDGLEMGPQDRLSLTRHR